MTTVEKKEKFVKYWEMEEPVVLTTTKNEIRFFVQHGKVQVYPKIEAGRGIGKGATINLDGFETADVAKFKELFLAMANTEIFETHKSYWNHEEPVTLSNDVNEIRFYQEHGKIQVYPKISVGRGIGKGASINMDVAATLRDALNRQMLTMLDSLLGVDMEGFEPVNEFDDEQVVTNTLVNSDPDLSEFELFKMFQKYARMDEGDIKEHAINLLFSDETAKSFALNTLNSYVFEEAVAILQDELVELARPHNYQELLKVTPDKDGLKIEALVDREFLMDWEQVALAFVELNIDLMEDGIEEEEEEDLQEEETVEDDFSEEETDDDDFSEEETGDDDFSEEETVEEEIITETVVEVEEEEVFPTLQTAPIVNESVPAGTGDVSAVASMSLTELKAEYVKHAFSDKKEYDAPYTVALFEELLSRKKAGADFTL